jgi:hypothetical protein
VDLEWDYWKNWGGLWRLVKHVLLAPLARRDIAVKSNVVAPKACISFGPLIMGAETTLTRRSVDSPIRNI